MVGIKTKEDVKFSISIILIFYNYFRIIYNVQFYVVYDFLMRILHLINMLTGTSENDLPVPTRICLSEEDFQLEIGPREFPPVEGGISAWYNVASR